MISLKIKKNQHQYKTINKFNSDQMINYHDVINTQYADVNLFGLPSFLFFYTRPTQVIYIQVTTNFTSTDSNKQ
ncbi:hypothetical protein DERP_001437 [Dermatophagoides pteronyssinus]|uniref:Uncharacterized protein n=1 Tax=Dermatophagoides pteronyssinus TaxID=6956 RepID=A0ABQ8JEF8_DERPT|nr:hypothetical protein DERP_001437 [Dermatophagoides pteronyssinus]